MKHLKNINQFNESFDNSMFREISDIFIHLEDSGLVLDDVYKGTSLHIGTNEIITDFEQIPSVIVSNGKYLNSYKSLSIRLKPKYTPANDSEMYKELKLAIGHVESQFGIRLRHIYLRTPKGIWFSNVDVMENYLLKSPSNLKSNRLNILRNYFSLVSYIDITFEDFTSDFDDSIQAN